MRKRSILKVDYTHNGNPIIRFENTIIEINNPVILIWKENMVE